MAGTGAARLLPVRMRLRQASRDVRDPKHAMEGVGGGARGRTPEARHEAGKPVGESDGESRFLGGLLFGGYGKN